MLSSPRLRQELTRFYQEEDSDDDIPDLEEPDEVPELEAQDGQDDDEVRISTVTVPCNDYHSCRGEAGRRK